jgi:SAM-dependent methyltransferase
MPHRHREVAESFGTEAERYDRARPSYPDELIAAIVAASPGPAFLDVGIGTGIAARQFAARGCTVLGVEVDPRMATLARARGCEVEVAKFEEWDAAGRTFDAIVSAQTWHWIDPVAGADKAAATLRPASAAGGAAAAAGAPRPGGLLALFWNVFMPPPDMAAAFAAVYRAVMPDLPFNPWAGSSLDAYDGILGKAEDGIRATGAFGEPERLRVDWEREYTREEWLDVLPTAGGHSRLPPEQLAALMSGIGDAVDAAGGRFVMGYAAVALLAERRQAAVRTPQVAARPAS